MAVSKRTRYEVLRRDNNTCRYCGASAPDVKLTVDHVTPVALGGGDDPSNLVAACTDCNAGKTSTNPDAPLVAQVSDDALRWSQAMQAALNDAAFDAQNRIDYRDMFLTAWNGWTVAGEPLPLPDDWSRTIDRWGALPVPIVILEDAVRVTMTTTTVKVGAKWKYFCGVVWRTLDKARESVETQLSPTVETDRKCGHCFGCRSDSDYCSVYGDLEPDEDPILCDHCGRRDCLFGAGYDDGSQDGWMRAADTYAPLRDLVTDYRHHILLGDMLERFIDGRLDNHHEPMRVNV